MKILSIGPLWRGSDAGGLFHAISRQGCLIEVIDEFYFISLQTKKISTKILEHFIRPLQVVGYNNAIMDKIKLFKPNILFIYKGAFVFRETLLFARKESCKLVLFYPDVSMTNHGPNIPKCIPIYDMIFTTKTFGIKDMRQMYGVNHAHFIEHGFDPEIHRKLNIDNVDRMSFGCDVSFIGTYSPKKELWLDLIKKALPNINLKIWGGQWHKSTSSYLKSAIQYTTVLGDIYALAIQCSKINLGILSEKVVGSSSGDLITARTFHIPASNGFLLHERNEESILYFEEDVEAGFFDTTDELIKKITFFLDNPDIREKIKESGHKRALKDYSFDVRAKTLLSNMEKLL